MGVLISYPIRYSVIKNIKVSEPLSIIVFIDVLYHSSLKLVDIFESSFLEHNG
jgi:hypothetical protein